MAAFHTTILTVIFASGIAMAEEESWWDISGAPEQTSALPATGGTRAVLATDIVARSALHGFIMAAPAKAFPSQPEGAKQEIRNRSAILQKLVGSTPEMDLTIDWLGGDGQASKERHEIHLRDGRIQNTYRLRSTTIVRTILVAQDGTVFIHFHADQPGALSFKVGISTSAAFETKIEDRRQIILSPSNPEASLRSHVWVIPFESDVATEGKSITVRGEGEALIIWTFAPGKTPAETLAGTLEALGKLYDPGDIPANPSLIWQGVSEKHLKSAENSP